MNAGAILDFDERTCLTRSRKERKERKERERKSFVWLFHAFT
jgi:hypothetical protein